MSIDTFVNSKSRTNFVVWWGFVIDGVRRYCDRGRHWSVFWWWVIVNRDWCNRWGYWWRLLVTTWLSRHGLAFHLVRHWSSWLSLVGFSCVDYLFFLCVGHNLYADLVCRMQSVESGLKRSSVWRPVWSCIILALNGGLVVIVMIVMIGGWWWLEWLLCHQGPS